jgi:hypothetical protein
MKLLTYEKAEAELVGHIIILGITVLGVGMIALYGVPSILSLQDMANAKNAEQTFTVLDFRATRAVSGDSPLQIADVNLGGGTLTVEPNSTNSTSYIVVAPAYAIKIDNRGTSADYNCGSWPLPSCTNTNINITNFAVGSGTNRLLVVGLHYFNNPGNTTVTYNGVALNRSMRANNGNYYAELWYMINPPSGSYTIAQTQINPTPVAIGAWSYTGVAGIGNITSLTSNSVNSNVNITTTVANSILVDVDTDAAPSNPYLTINPGQTARYDDTSLHDIDGGGSEMSTSNIGIYNMNWTVTGGAPWVNIAAEIKPAAGVNYNVTIPMGKIIYQLGDRTIAYEGNGVWSKYPSGSVMLSPPDFHYDGITLTLPVINISGSASVGGRGTAAVSFKKKSTPLVQYPKPNWTNPINYNAGDKVYMNITSDFYDAWADYARSLSYTKVSENKTTHTTSIEFTVAPVTLERNSSITNPIVFRWLNPGDSTPLDNFSFRIYGTPSLTNLNWQMSTQSGTKTLVIQLDQYSSGWIEIRVGYQDISIGKPNAELWINSSAFPINTTAIPNYADIDLLNSIYLTYTDHDTLYNDYGVPSSGNACGLSIGSSLDTPAYSWLPGKVINAWSQQSLYNVTQHYFQLMMQDVPLNHCLESGNIDYVNSTMHVNYTGNLSYLYVTDNRGDVGIS